MTKLLSAKDGEIFSKACGNINEAVLESMLGDIMINIVMEIPHFNTNKYDSENDTDDEDHYDDVRS